jgi:cytochrome c biogenesis protein ResB
MDGYTMIGFTVILTFICISWSTCFYEILTDIHTKRRNTCYHNPECLEQQKKQQKTQEDEKPFKRHQDIRDIVC